MSPVKLNVPRLITEPRIAILPFNMATKVKFGTKVKIGKCWYYIDGLAAATINRLFFHIQRQPYNYAAFIFGEVIFLNQLSPVGHKYPYRRMFTAHQVLIALGVRVKTPK
jgi:hypothetical protein